MTDIIGLAPNVAIALSFLIGLVFGVAQVRAAARDRRDRLTLEALHNFQSRDFVEQMQYVISHDLPADRKELRSLPAGEQVYFLQFAQQMEMLGILVAEKLLNLDLVEKTLGNLVTSTWEKYKPISEGLRKEDLFLNEYFQWLAERIDERMVRHPRKPFYSSRP